MITISKLAKLFGISEQTVRMYERYHLVNTQRDPVNGYRMFSLNSFTDLIKTRILQGLGFSMNDVHQLMTDCSYEETMRLFYRQKAQLEERQRLLMEQMAALERIRRSVEEIQKRNNTCCYVHSQGWYIQPVLSDDTLFIDGSRTDLNTWNRYAYMRQDINILDTDDHWKSSICFGFSESDAAKLGVTFKSAQYIPPGDYLSAWCVCDSDVVGDYRSRLDFAVKYLEESGHRVSGRILLFLPYTSGSGNGTYYHEALIPFC